MSTNKSLPLKKSSSRNWLTIVTLIMIVALILISIFHVFLLKTYGRFLNVGQPLEHPVNAVFVLGGDINTRPFVAVEILKANYASKLLYCGVADLKDQARMVEGTEDYILLKIMAHSGLANFPCLNIGNNVNSTIDEAKALSAYLQDHPLETVAVVTNDYHTRRARLIFRHQCHNNKNRLRIVSAPTDFYGPDSWWKSGEGRLYYCFEGVKLLTTLLPGGRD